MSPTYGHMTKLFLESEFQHKGNIQMKKTRILCKILLFSWQEQVQKTKLFKYYTDKNQNIKWTKLSLLGQEPTFKSPNKNAADEIMIFYFYLLKKIRFDFSYESYA